MKIICYLFFLLLLVSTNLFSYEVFIPETLMDFVYAENPTANDIANEIKKQKHYKLTNAKIVWVDYDLMREYLPKLHKKTNVQIEEWILNNFARISELQLQLQNIRTDKIQYDPENYVELIHPNMTTSTNRYMRSSVDIKNKIDLKGSGNANIKSVVDQVAEYNVALGSKDSQTLIDSIRIKDHSDGLMSLGEAIVEVMRQQAIQMGYDLKNTSKQTIESLFIIDTGINLLKPNGEKMPTAILGRQMHLRGEIRNEPEILDIFQGLRNTYQVSETHAAVDMGLAKIVLEEIKSNFEFYGNGFDPQNSRDWQLAHELAKEYVQLANNDLNAAKEHIRFNISQILSPLYPEWQKIRMQNIGEVKADAHHLYASLLFRPQPNVRKLALKKLNEFFPKYKEDTLEAISFLIRRSHLIYLELILFLNSTKISDDSINSILLKKLIVLRDKKVLLKIIEYLISKNIQIPEDTLVSVFSETGKDNNPKNRKNTLSVLKLMAASNLYSVDKLLNRLIYANRPYYAELFNFIESNPTLLGERTYKRLIAVIEEKGALFNPVDTKLQIDAYKLLSRLNAWQDTSTTAQAVISNLTAQNLELRKLSLAQLNRMTTIYDPETISYLARSLSPTMKDHNELIEFLYSHDFNSANLEEVLTKLSTQESDFFVIVNKQFQNAIKELLKRKSQHLKSCRILLNSLVPGTF